MEKIIIIFTFFIVIFVVDIVLSVIVVTEGRKMQKLLKDNKERK